MIRSARPPDGCRLIVPHLGDVLHEGLHRGKERLERRARSRTSDVAFLGIPEDPERGIDHQPSQAWMVQVARNLTDATDGFLRNARYLIHDRDPMFTELFVQTLKAAGVTTVKLPARSPNLNAYAERWVRSLRQECLRRIVPLSERHLRKIVAEYVEHYHLERNHQGLGNKLIVPTSMNARAPVLRRERLGGILNFYFRDAA
jgi:putative transposase